MIEMLLTIPTLGYYIKSCLPGFDRQAKSRI